MSVNLVEMATVISRATKNYSTTTKKKAEYSKLTESLHLRKIQIPMTDAMTTAAIMTPTVKAVAVLLVLLVSSLCPGSIVGPLSSSFEALVAVGSFCPNGRF